MIDSIRIAGIWFPICDAHHSFTFLDLPGTPFPRQVAPAAGCGAAFDGRSGAFTDAQFLGNTPRLSQGVPAVGFLPASLWMLAAKHQSGCNGY